MIRTFGMAHHALYSQSKHVRFSLFSLGGLDPNNCSLQILLDLKKPAFPQCTTGSLADPFPLFLPLYQNPLAVRFRVWTTQKKDTKRNFQWRFKSLREHCALLLPLSTERKRRSKVELTWLLLGFYCALKTKLIVCRFIQGACACFLSYGAIGWGKRGKKRNLKLNLEMWVFLFKYSDL